MFEITQKSCALLQARNAPYKNYFSMKQNFLNDKMTSRGSI